MICYNKKVIERFKNPRHAGEIKNPSGIAEEGNLRCGDVMRVYIKVGKNRNGKEIIKEARFKTYGCAAAIAASDVACELIEGKGIEKAKEITNKKITAKLGGLPIEKIHCSVLGMQTLRKAIDNYLTKSQNKERDKKKEER